jgi:hypothetical protein
MLATHDHKYLHMQEYSNMGATEEQIELSADDELKEQRERIRASLDEIAIDVGISLRDAGLNYPIYMTVPTSGDSVATIATPVDPSDDDWEYTTAIACRVIGARLGEKKLITRHLRCAMANATMGAADVVADPRID